MKKTNESGMVIIEATFVFPIMFFVLLFLIYMGNVYYMRSQIDTITYKAALQGAANCADPYLDELESSGSPPSIGTNCEPYRYIIGMDSDKILKDTKEKIQKLGGGFFFGMEAKNVNVTGGFENHLFYYTYKVEASYKIKFPIRFFWSSEPTIMKMSSRSIVSCDDPSEFVDNIDMIKDYMDKTGATEAIQNGINKITGFFDH